jgi:chitin synthase
MKNNNRCGGVCGYMNLRIERLEEEEESHKKKLDCLSNIALHFVDIQRAQQVEYHFAHLIDKPFEALFNFIHVLPGAFSAYRSDALKLFSKEDSKLMREYFKSLD